MTDNVVDTNSFFGNKHSVLSEFSVRICTSKLNGQKAYHGGHTDMIIDMYIHKMNILYFTRFYVRFSISKLEAEMLTDLLRADGQT